MSMQALLAAEQQLSCRLDMEFLNGEFLRLQKIRGLISKRLVDESILQTAEKFRIAIFVNPVNQRSYQHFLRCDVQSKTLDIQSKTLKQGIRSGFLTAEQEFPGMKRLQAKFVLGKKTAWAIQQAVGEEISLEQNRGPALFVGAYKNGKLITSDIDAVLIASRDDFGQECPETAGFGVAMELEKEVLFYANSCFQKQVEDFFPDLAPYRFELFTHGPACRFHHAQRKWLHFPMTLYCEKWGIISFGEERKKRQSIALFTEYCRLLQREGYQVPLHENWEIEL